MGAAAFSLHDERSEILRENDAVHGDVEGSMTPERIAEIAKSACKIVDTRYATNLAIPSAIERAITLAVNEALSEALKPAMSEAMFWSDTDDTRAYKACELIIGAIDAMKIPEES